jgi:hypothetical protein
MEKMQYIEVITLVDITRPPVSRPNQGTEQQQDQYKNWITLLQCVGLRSNIEYENDPRESLIDISNMEFGTKYKGTHRVWTFRFSPDRREAYMNDQGNIIGLLLEDMNQVPIIKNLTETINISKAVLDLNSRQVRNTVVRVHTKDE